MATDSKNKKKARRQKIAARIANQTNRQRVRDLTTRLVNTQFPLLAVLTVTGPVTVPQDISTQVMEEFTHLRWSMDRNEDGSVTVKVVNDTPVVEPNAPEDPVVPARSVTAQLAAQPIDAVDETVVAE